MRRDQRGGLVIKVIGNYLSGLNESQSVTGRNLHTRRREMLTMTRGMNDRVAADLNFAKHVTDSFLRFARRDWGEMADEDIKANDWSVDNGARVLAGYGEGEDRIWIIREHDASVTTVLFPSEY